MKTFETKIVDGAIREDSGSLQAGGHRFDPGHVHQISKNFRVAENQIRLRTFVLTSSRSGVILGSLNILVDIGVAAEKEVIQ